MISNLYLKFIQSIKSKNKILLGSGIIGIIYFSSSLLWNLLRSFHGTKIEGKLIIVTGASSGIGEATSKAISAKGGKVILVARTKAKLDEIVQEIKSNGGEAYSYSVDLSDSSAVEEFVKIVKSNHGIPDIIVNNAGKGRWLFLRETSSKEAIEMIETPYLSAFYLTKGFINEFFQRNNGHIVNINSPAAVATWPGAIGYISARQCFYAFSQALRQEVRGTNIKVTNCIFGQTSSGYWDNNPGSKERIPSINYFFGTLSPNQVAQYIIKSIENNKKEIIKPQLLSIAISAYKNPLFNPIINYLIYITSPKFKNLT